MAEKRKISIRKVLQAVLTLVVTTGCVVAVVSASGIQKAKKLKDVHLEVVNEGEQAFLDKEAIWRELMQRKALKKNGARLDSLDIKSVEQAVYRNPWVADAQVYVDNQRAMHINLVQRVPVARVFLESGESYYLDASLKLLPLSELFTYYTVIVTNVPVTKDDSVNKRLYASLVRLVRHIEGDSFWNAQIAQIIVTPEREFELVPVLGKHKILFGDTSRMEQKFRHLFAFYKNVLNRIGWEKYELVDLRYRNQLVASPALPWKPASKNGISNMDWLKSIMGEAPVETSVAAGAPAAVPELKATTVKPQAAAQVKAEKDNKQDAVPGRTVNTEGNEPAKAKYIFQGTNSN